MTFDLFIFAGEASGDLHGAYLLQKISKIFPNLKIAGVLGPKMREAKVFNFLDMEEFEVMGFLDIIFSLPKILKHFFKIKKFILQNNIKTCIFIDYPGFNLRIEKSLKKAGFSGKIIHYACPTVWAWGKKRIKTMVKFQDLLMTIFPFEKKIFKNTSLRVEYVGNPLLDCVKKFSKTSFRVPAQVGLFCGSRKKEIQRNLPYMLEAAKKLVVENPSINIAISISQKKYESLIKDIASPFKMNDHLIIFDSKLNYEIIKNIKIAIATSGTITLELALHKIPTVVIYHIKKIDLFIAKNLLKINLPFYCIVNIICQKEIFPELFGPNLTKKSLFQSVKNIFYSPEKYIKNCQEVIDKMEKSEKKDFTSCLKEYLL